MMLALTMKTVVMDMTNDYYDTESEDNCGVTLMMTIAMLIKMVMVVKRKQKGKSHAMHVKELIKHNHFISKWKLLLKSASVQRLPSLC